ncbi:cyclophilin-like fold protein [Streptococcus respiraculi]|uniref:cyclophilin-like fold protein n=1 Tax=Streptococcus respiraculi TaxID=2021971 RepID=UPI000E718019|nr:cyclophilin-like fold protein [Streptococcus respiraculi]
MVEQAIRDITIQIGREQFRVSLEGNQATRELVALLTEAPMTIDVSDYAGFEKVGSLGRLLTSSDQKMTTQNGDIVLYNSRQLVLFYGSNTWSYTKIGSVTDKEGWKQALEGAPQALAVSLIL